MASMADNSSEELTTLAATLYGAKFIHEIPRLLAIALGVRNVIIADVVAGDNARLRALAFWAGERFIEDHTYALADTPCQNVVGKQACDYPDRVQELFPRDRKLKTFGIQGYVGVPLFSAAGDALGLIAALHDQPIDNVGLVTELLGRYAGRIGAELEHMPPRRAGKIREKQSFGSSKQALMESENRLKESQSVAHLGHYSLDIQTGCWTNSDELDDIFGLDKNLTRDVEAWMQIIHPEFKEEMTAYLRQHVLEDHNNFDKEYKIINLHTRQEKWVHGLGRLILDEENNPVEMFGTIQDITDRKNIDIALQQSEARYERAIQGTHDGLWDWNIITDENYFSPQWLALLGYREGDIEKTGRAFVLLIHDRDRTTFDQALCSHFEHDRVFDVEIRLLCGDGDYKWFRSRGEVSRDETGRPHRMAGSITDIMDRKNAELQLLNAMAEARIANKAKSEFLASMSHELRTPLNAVLGFAQMLKFDPQCPLSGTQNDHVENILSGGNHLLGLVNEILDLVKMESNNLDLSLDAVNANEIVSYCVQTMKSIGAPREIRIIDRLAKEQPMFLHTDQQRFRQVLLNLLSNAVNFNREGGTVTVAGQKTNDDYLRISVTDTGLGIAKEDFDGVFQLFNRLDANPMIAREGTGIGLTMTKRLVERMAGRIGLESEKGIGSTFWVELPLALENEAPSPTA